MDKLKLHQQIKQGIVDYSKQFEREQLGDQKIEGLLSYLNEKTGHEVSFEQAKDSCYSRDAFFDWAKFMEDRPVAALTIKAERDIEVINRVSKILGKSISDMDADEMKEAAKKMFMTTAVEYKRLADEKGIELDEDFFQRIYSQVSLDTTVLLDVLKKVFDVSLEREELVKKVQETDMGLGYFENMFQKKFKANSGNQYYKDRDIRDFWEMFNRDYDEFKNDFDRHAEFEGSFKHKMPQPRLLEDAIKCEIRPFAISYCEGRLIVLGQRHETDDDFDKFLTLEAYEDGKQIKSVKTKLSSSFSGCAIGAFSFQGNLSVGSNGIIYAGGDNHIIRFNKDLEVVDNEDGFQDALKVLKDNDFFDFGGPCHWALSGIFQIAENDGIHYFVIRPNNHPRCYANQLVATDGKKIIGEPIVFSPSGGFGGTQFDDTARIIVHGNDIYMKSEHNILAVDRSLAKEAFEKAAKVIDGEQLDSGCIPSNHCVDKNGLLWVVTQMKQEAASSIKAYSKNQVMTYFYPLNHPGGWPSMRTMAIHDNILAYTDIHKQQINFYQIEW